MISLKFWKLKFKLQLLRDRKNVFCLYQINSAAAPMCSKSALHSWEIGGGGGALFIPCCCEWRFSRRRSAPIYAYVSKYCSQNYWCIYANVHAAFIPVKKFQIFIHMHQIALHDYVAVSAKVNSCVEHWICRSMLSRKKCSARWGQARHLLSHSEKQKKIFISLLKIKF